MRKSYIHKYLEFASNISFFEFLQEEFKKARFDINKYKTEIEELSRKNEWNIGELSEFLRKYPKSFEIFEEIFQLKRFTNTQLIHFLFDTPLLNNLEEEKILEYLKKNLEHDETFVKIFIKNSKKLQFDNIKFNDVNKIIDFIKTNKDEKFKNYLIFLLKVSVMNYVKLAIKKPSIIHNRISNSNFKDVSERIAKYLIKNLHLNDILKGINVKKFLEKKRIPIDTKSIHGNFGKIKISEILKKHDFINADSLFNKNNIKTLTNDLTEINGLEELKEKFIFVTERYIEGLIKKRDKKPKKFDFILLYNLKPKIVIETNFYSTSGTKIGINQGEYIDLNEDIKRRHNYLTFIWITDGNYWLTSEGKNRLLNLYNYFGDYVLNYNLFDKRLDNLKIKMKQNT